MSRQMRPGRAPTTTARRAPADAHARSAFGRVLAMLLVIGIGAYAYSLIAPRFAATPTPSVAVPRTSSAVTTPTSIAPATATAPAVPAAAAPAQHFQCDGRTHCAQMTSCEEATYCLRTCPGVQMDGNHDGVPCERQWCH
ncbi:excalibur calcium-binding domain-containing protein [Xanthomonas translucens pv. cerealis]|nr:excalibur calcium-binding domain-containing protein [Xanthomonas translucens pv. cerealis]